MGFLNSSISIQKQMCICLKATILSNSVSGRWLPYASRRAEIGGNVLTVLTWLMQDGRNTADLGTLLLTFLMRYGRSFDYDQHAVSVGQGGVILRAALADPIPAGHIVQLIVEDVDTKRYAMTVKLFICICHAVSVRRCCPLQSQ